MNNEIIEIYSNTLRESFESSSSMLREFFENSSRVLRERIAFLALCLIVGKFLVVSWFKKYGGDIVGGIFLILLLLGIGYTVKTYVIPVLPWIWSSSGSLLSWLWVSSWSILVYLWSGFWSILVYLWLNRLWILLVFAVLVVLGVFGSKYEAKHDKKRLFVERMKRAKLAKRTLNGIK